MSLLGDLLAPRGAAQGDDRPDLSWFYVVINRFEDASVVQASDGFWDTDLFPSTDALECGIFIPTAFRDKPGLYRVTNVKVGGAVGPDMSGEWDGPEISGQWTPVFSILPDEAHLPVKS